MTNNSVSFSPVARKHCEPFSSKNLDQCVHQCCVIRAMKSDQIGFPSSFHKKYRQRAVSHGFRQRCTFHPKPRRRLLVLLVVCDISCASSMPQAQALTKTDKDSAFERRVQALERDIAPSKNSIPEPRKHTGACMLMDGHRFCR